MSRENVEVVRRLAEAFNSGEPQRALSCLHPEVEFTSTVSALDVGTYVGFDGMRRYVDDLASSWESWHSEDGRFLDAGGEQVVWLHRVLGRGRVSGAPLNQPIGIVWTLRDGMLWRGKAYLNHAEALKAVGLEE